MLSVLSGCIGNSTVLQLKSEWLAPSIIWTALIGKSGSAKTPAFRCAMNPIRDIERQAHEDYVSKLKEFDLVKSEGEKSKTEPIRSRHIVSDATVEALAPLLQDNPRGLILGIDELNGWISGFDRYKNAKGADSSAWLSMYCAENLAIDRKTGDRKQRAIYVPRASISITGGIQPEVLHRSLGKEHRENGLAARILFAYPPRVSKKWTEKEVDSSIILQYADVIQQLVKLNPDIDTKGRDCPRKLKLSEDAHQHYVEFYNSHNKQGNKLPSELAAAWSKLEEIPARIAIAIHCVKQVTDRTSLKSQDIVDDVTMQSAIKLTEWFKREAKRVYASLNTDAKDAKVDKKEELKNWIERKGEGEVSVRDVQQGRSIRTSEEAQRQLNVLYSDGFGQWGRRGRKTVFRLFNAPRSLEGFHPIDETV